MGRPRIYDTKHGSQEKYKQQHRFRFTLEMYDSNNADMIAYLKFKAGKESTGNYIRRLIREDMERSGFVYTPAPEDSPEE